jgi:hypothetical protein
VVAGGGRTGCFFAALAILACWFASVGTTDALLNARAWRSASLYPDSSYFPESNLLEHRPNTAISFSGGGSRAYIAAMGYLAALRDLDLLKNVRYIGGISGGSWATIAFTYLQNHTDDNAFLGEIVPPEAIRFDKLKFMDPRCARAFPNTNFTAVAKEVLEQGIAHTPADGYALATSDVYLAPISVPLSTRFSWDEDTVADIKRRNPQLENATFTIPVHDRPFPVIHITLVGPKEGAPFIPVTQNYTKLEITPLYFGTMKNTAVQYTYDIHGSKHTVLDGGVVEPFAAAWKGGGAPAQGLPENATSGILEVPEPGEFLDLRYGIGASSYAVGTFFESIVVPKLAQELCMQCDYWSPADPEPKLTTMMIGDGGAYENVNLFSFLQRRVPKIVLFFLTSVPLQPHEDWDVLRDPQAYDHISDDLAAFFGAINYSLPRYADRTYEYEKNTVFSLHDFDRVALGLQAAQREGKGIFYTANLTTIENTWWGIPGGLAFEITFAYLGRLSAWEALLTPGMQALVVPKVNGSDLSVTIQEGPFAGFPHYPTLAAGVNFEQANLLADMAGWSLLQHEELFRRMLS